MDIQLVCFDTSFVRSFHKKIEELYPPHLHLYCVSEPTDLELNDFNQKSKVDIDIRRKVFQTVLEMSPLLPRGQILEIEIEKYVTNKKPRADFVLCSALLQDKRRKYMIERDEKAIQKMYDRINSMNFFENYYWHCIQETSSGEITVNDQDITTEVNRLVEDKYPIYLENRINITSLIQANRVRFESDCPSNFNFIKTISLLNVLKKPFQSSKKFALTANGTKIDIKKSFITDIIIAATFLPYIDIFATCDKGQADILKFVFNNYAQKIIYHELSKST